MNKNFILFLGVINFLIEFNYDFYVGDKCLIRRRICFYLDLIVLFFLGRFLLFFRVLISFIFVIL